MHAVGSSPGAASLLPMDAAGRTVRPPSAAREALGFAAAAACVLLAGALRVATLPRGSGQAAVPSVSAVLSGSDQVVYQALLVSVDAVVTLRKKTGAWPDSPALASADVPPFAEALLPAAARGLRWEMRAPGSTADYAGVDPAGVRTAFLLRVAERGKNVSADVWIRKGGTSAVVGATPGREGWFPLVSLDGEAGGRR